MVRAAAMEDMGHKLDRIANLLEALVASQVNVQAAGTQEAPAPTETPNSVPPPSPAEPSEESGGEAQTAEPVQVSVARPVAKSHASAAVPSTRISHRPPLQGKFLRVVRPKKPLQTYHQFSESYSAAPSVEEDDTFIVKKAE